MLKYSNFESACNESVFEKSVSNSFVANIDGDLKHVEIVKPKSGDGYLVYKRSGVKIRKATAGEIDGATFWKSY